MFNAGIPKRQEQWRNHRFKNLTWADMGIPEAKDAKNDMQYAYWVRDIFIDHEPERQSDGNESEMILMDFSLSFFISLRSGHDLTQGCVIFK